MTQPPTTTAQFAINTETHYVSAPEAVALAMMGTIEHLRRKYNTDDVKVTSAWKSKSQCECVPGQYTCRLRSHDGYWRATICISGVSTRWWYRTRGDKARWERSR
jgi:hypothetical protein